jgi:hypothetical protein
MSMDQKHEKRTHEEEEREKLIRALMEHHKMSREQAIHDLEAWGESSRRLLQALTEAKHAHSLPRLLLLYILTVPGHPASPLCLHDPRAGRT